MNRDCPCAACQFLRDTRMASAAAIATTLAVLVAYLLVSAAR